MSWTPGQKVVFDTTRNGNSDLWMIDQNGSAQKQLTISPAADYAPEISRDGKSVIFLSNRNGVTNLWRMNPDGTGIRQITNSGVNINAGVSTDGKYAYYSQRIGENISPFLWKISLEGGEAIQLTEKATLFPQVSPDGKLIACFYADKTASFGTKLSILSAEDASLVKQFDISSQGALSRISWSQDGRKILYLKIQDGVSTIFEQSLETESPVKVIESKSDTIFRFALSPDDRTLVYENGGYVRDVVLVESVE
jgi:Tol biopolymer transport system component